MPCHSLGGFGSAIPRFPFWGLYAHLRNVDDMHISVWGAICNSPEWGTICKSPFCGLYAHLRNVDDMHISGLWSICISPFGGLFAYLRLGDYLQVSVLGTIWGHPKIFWSPDISSNPYWAVVLMWGHLVLKAIFNSKSVNICSFL